MNQRSGMKVMMKLVGLVKPLTSYMILAIVMGLIGHLMATMITVFGVYALLHLLGFEIFLTLQQLFLMMIIFAMFRGILRYVEQACNHFIAFRLLALIRDRVFSALRILCPAKLEGKDKGDLISVMTTDIELLEVFYAHTISPIIIAFLFSLIMVIYISSFHILLGLTAIFAYVVIGVFIPYITAHMGGDDGMRFRHQSGELSSFILDSLRGLFEIIQYNQGQQCLDIMNQKTDELLKDEERMKKGFGYNQAFIQATILIFDLAMFVLSAYLYMQDQISFVGVVIPTVALMSSFGPVISLANLGSTLQNTLASGNRVLDILEEKPIVNEIENQEDVSFDGMQVEHVSFGYEQPILQDISLDISQGSMIGIVGKSGSGKSTLLKLMMRFWEAQKGNISISHTNINYINTSSLRNIESYVTQQTHLFHDSIKENLKIAKLDATDEEIMTACQKASIHDFIMSLPQGYDTPVGELGDMLSGGERQRIGLARSFLHDADLLLLDEPTSNLDSLNEAIILKSLKEEKANKTVVLVSHRESTMRIVDRSYSVENGRMS